MSKKLSKLEVIFLSIIRLSRLSVMLKRPIAVKSEVMSVT